MQRKLEGKIALITGAELFVDGGTAQLRQADSKEV